MTQHMSDWTEPLPRRPETLPDEIEHVKGIVGKYFPIYDVKVHFDTISLYCNVDPVRLEEKFEELRLEMKGLAYIPILTYERGEHVVHVVKQPKMKFKSNWVNIVLLVATICTTILAGAVLWAAISGSDDLFAPTNLLNGALYFALPLMLILGVHELAHYYAAKKHGIAASLPFFIPIPPFFVIPIGTMGAFISIREPIPNKKALLDIGVSGPIAGLLVAIPVTMIGLLLSSPVEVTTASGIIEGGTTSIGDSLLFYTLRLFLPVPDSIIIHPTAFAGWVGLFVTALNLLPAGQLDGGHIARAIFGRNARYAGYGAFALMIGLGLFTVYSGWLIFALLIMILGMRHPPPLNDITKLDNRRKAFGMITAVILVLCFVPIPFYFEQPVYDVEFGLVMDNGALVPSYGENITSSTNWLNISEKIRLVNNGNVDTEISLRASTSNNSLCNVTLVPELDPANISRNQWANLSIEESANFTVRMSIPPNVTGNVTVRINAYYYYQNQSVDPMNVLNEEVNIYIELQA